MEASHVDMIISYLLIPVTTVVSVVGTFGNIVIIAAICIEPRLRHISNALVLSQAVANAWITGISATFSIVALSDQIDFFNTHETMCKTIGGFSLTALLASLITGAVISLNNLVHFRWKDVHTRMFSTSTIFPWAFNCWFLSFLLQVPALTSDFGEYGFDTMSKICLTSRANTPFYNRYISVLCLAIISSTMTNYAVIMWLQKKLTKQKVQDQNPLLGLGDTDKDLMKTMLKASFIQSLTWSLLAFLWMFDVTHKTPTSINIIAIQIVHFGAAINVAIYGISNQEFREGYVAVYSLLCGRREPNTTTHQTQVTSPYESLPNAYSEFLNNSSSSEQSVNNAPADLNYSERIDISITDNEEIDFNDKEPITKTVDYDDHHEKTPELQQRITWTITGHK